MFKHATLGPGTGFQNSMFAQRDDVTSFSERAQSSERTGKGRNEWAKCECVPIDTQNVNILLIC